MLVSIFLKRHRFFYINNKIVNAMQDKKNDDKQQKHNHPLSREIPDKEKQVTKAAFENAMHDIDEDADLSIRSPNDDLDEGEIARLGDDKPPLV
jgi:hypothetical protein